MTPETELPTTRRRRTPAEDPPSTLIIYIAVLFAAWLLYLLYRPEAGNDAPAWVPYINHMPGFAIALLMAEGLYRHSRFTWVVALSMGALSILIAFLNSSTGTRWAGIFTGGQAVIGAIQIVLLLLPPTQRWVKRGRLPDAPPPA